MEGRWPLILDGVECGFVTAEKRGAYTVFTARALYTGELKRISLYGGGVEGVLGVLAPDGEEVSLTRRFTRSELAAFPAEPEYAAESGGSPRAEPRPDAGHESCAACLCRERLLLEKVPQDWNDFAVGFVITELRKIKTGL